MHKMLKKEEAQVTRFVTLKNIDTGTEDYCFDDSDVVDIKHKDFYFMEIGEKYNCKIELFGDTQSGKVGEKAHCRVVRDNVLIGDRRRVEVKVGEDIYYIPRKKVEEQLKQGEFEYYYSRKDLVQVDNVIHGKYLD